MGSRWDSGPQRTFRSLRHRNYRLLWLGATGHAASLWMDQVARAVLILQLTDSALMLSLVIATRLAAIKRSPERSPAAVESDGQAPKTSGMLPDQP